MESLEHAYGLYLFRIFNSSLQFLIIHYQVMRKFGDSIQFIEKLETTGVD